MSFYKKRLFYRRSFSSLTKHGTFCSRELGRSDDGNTRIP
ncbi:unnamed protein product, partial [Ixodes pacificus]